MLPFLSDQQEKKRKKKPCCVRWLDSSHMLLLERELLFI